MQPLLNEAKLQLTTYEKQVQQAAKARAARLAKPSRKIKRTLLREMVIEKAVHAYQENLMRNWDRITKKHIDELVKPANVQERLYAISQIVGKPVERIAQKGEITLKIDI